MGSVLAFTLLSVLLYKYMESTAKESLRGQLHIQEEEPINTRPISSFEDGFEASVVKPAPEPVKPAVPVRARQLTKPELSNLAQASAAANEKSTAESRIAMVKA
ncbi:MAG: hypothetical protein WCK42_01680 [Myxococcaceae bacterium]